MGVQCSTSRCNEVGGGLKGIEPLDEAPVVAESDAYAFPAEIGNSDPAPITVNLHKPDVDVDAPLDERDIDLVQQTFARVALLGAANVGWVLFMNIFKLAPGAKSLFKFNDDVDVAMSTKMKTHAGKVVETFATAIGLLYNLDELVPVLRELGELHVGFSVVPAHYAVVGEALIAALTAALGSKMTPAVTNAYLKVYTLVKTNMIGHLYKEAAQAPEEVHPPQEVADEPKESEDDQKLKEDKAAESAKKKEEEEAKKKKDAAARKKAAAEKQKRKSELEKKQREEKEAKKKAEAETKKKEEDEARQRAADEAKAQRVEAWKAMDKKAQGKLIERLMKAAKDGSAPNAKAVLEENCLPDAEDKDGQTALHYAADKGRADVVKLLLEYGASPIAKVKLGEWGLCALHYAARQGHADIAMLVYHAKAMGNDNFLKKTPIDIAKEKGHDDLASALKKLHSPPKKK